MHFAHDTLWKFSQSQRYRAVVERFFSADSRRLLRTTEKWLRDQRPVIRAWSMRRKYVEGYLKAIGHRSGQ